MRKIFSLLSGSGFPWRALSGVTFVAAFAVMAAVGPAPRFDSWKIIGPGGGGTMIEPVISPHDPNTVFEHCDMTGAYVTRDGGQSWRMFNLRGVARTFAFDPSNRQVIYAGNWALWRSEDTGKTWRMLFPDPKKNTREQTRGDHAESFAVTDDPTFPKGLEIGAIAVDPKRPERVLAVFEGGPHALLFASDNRGRTWRQAHEFDEGRILQVYAAPAAGGGDVYAIGEKSIHVGKDAAWKSVPAPNGGPIHFASLGWSAVTNAPVIYATVAARWKGSELEGGVYVSRDAGQTWQPALTGLKESLYKPGEGRPPSFEAIACSERNPLTVYVSLRGLRLGPARKDRYNGIAKTTDGGLHWTIVHRESDNASGNLTGSWIEQRAVEDGPSIWFDAPYSLGVAPTNPSVCYATDLFRTYRTIDGGTSWEEVNSVSAPPDRWTTRGLDVTTNYGVHFDPFNRDHIFISYTDIGLFQSSDRGASWIGSTEGIPRQWRNTTYWIEFDPKVKNLLWGGFSGTHDLPRPKMWRRTNPDRYQGGVAVSTDGGLHWKPSNQGMDGTAVTHLILDPGSPVGKRVLYAAGFGRGVFKSVDNGVTWELKNNGIEPRQPFAWRLTPDSKGTLYLVVARRNDGGRIGDSGDGALYKSSDAAEHWTRMSLPEGVNGPMGLAVDPRDARRLYLSTWGVEHVAGDTGGGVYLSTDGGATWRNIFHESQHVYDLTIDPREPGTLYVCGFDSAAWRSTDSGTTWKRIRGYNFKWGHRVIPDPADRAGIYVTTYGGSVWHGPAAGDQSATEDIIWEK